MMIKTKLLLLFSFLLFSFLSSPTLLHATSIKDCTESGLKYISVEFSDPNGLEAILSPMPIAVYKNPVKFSKLCCRTSWGVAALEVDNSLILCWQGGSTLDINMSTKSPTIKFTAFPNVTGLKLWMTYEIAVK